MKILVVVAVEAERAAIAAQLPLTRSRAAWTAHTSAGALTVVVGGVGIAASAAATSAALTADPHDLVLSCGIAGGLDGVPVGSVFVADAAVCPELGHVAADGTFVTLSTMGLGNESIRVQPDVVDRLSRRLVATGIVPFVGPVLSVNTVTSSAEQARKLSARFGVVAAEAMEGFGVATAAQLAGVPFGEIRAISNVVGPRDVGAWRIGAAVQQAASALAAVCATPW